jgi:hypothetical protein
MSRRIDQRPILIKSAMLTKKIEVEVYRSTSECGNNGGQHLLITYYCQCLRALLVIGEDVSGSLALSAGTFQDLFPAPQDLRLRR